MFKSKRIVFGFCVLALFTFVPSTAVAQGLVEYALVLVIEGGASPNTYQLCAANPFPTARSAEFAFQPSGVSTTVRPFDIQSLVLELAPYETGCREFTPLSAGVLCQLPSLRENFEQDGDVRQRNGGVRGCYPADGKVLPGPAVHVQIRKDRATGRLLPVQAWVLDGPGGTRQDNVPAAALLVPYFKVEEIE